MKKFLLTGTVLLALVIFFSGCTTSAYFTQPRAGRYYGRTQPHINNNRMYNSGHGNVYRGNSHGRVARGGHGRW